MASCWFLLSGCDDDGALDQSREQQVSLDGSPPVVASLGDRAITVAEFEAFLARARPPGHKIGSLQEAIRLLEAFAKEVALPELVHHDARANADEYSLRETLVGERVGAISVSESDIDSFVETHRSLYREKPPGSEERLEIRRQIRLARIQSMSEEILDHEVESELRSVDVDKLRRLVSRTDSTTPPLPPGLDPSSSRL